MTPKIKCKGHFWKDKARCYSADCSPSSSDTIVTHRIGEGLEFSSLSRARGRKMMKIMLSQLAPWTQFELPNLEPWEPKQFFKTNFANIWAMNDGQKLISLGLWHKHSCLWVMMTVRRALRIWRDTSHCLFLGDCLAPALCKGREEWRSHPRQEQPFLRWVETAMEKASLRSLTSCGGQWKDVDMAPLARAVVLPSRVEKQWKETSLWGFTDLGTSPEKNRGGKGKMSVRVSDLTTDILGWIILCWGDGQQDSCMYR